MEGIIRATLAMDQDSSPLPPQDAALGATPEEVPEEAPEETMGAGVSGVSNVKIKKGPNRAAGRRGRLTVEEKGRLWEALQEPRVKVGEVARKFGVSQVTVWTWNKKLKSGATKEEFMQPVDKSRRLTMEEKSRMYDALAEPGSSVTDVAQKFGVSYTTAWKWNEKFNNGLSKADFMQPGDSTRRLSMEERGRLWEALSVPDVNLTEVAREFKVSLGTVWKWNEKLKNGASKKDFSEPPQRDSYTRLTIEEKNRLWDKLSEPGVNVAKVAKEFGIHP